MHLKLILVEAADCVVVNQAGKWVSMLPKGFLCLLPVDDFASPISMDTAMPNIEVHL
jgi:hypothetical protein